MENYKILVINPGSTSTKVAVFAGEEQIAEAVIRHPKEELESCAGILDQRELRTNYVLNMLKEYNIPIEEIAAIAGRGGLIKPIDSGTYAINDRMKRDLISDSATVHASALGGIIAADIGEKYQIPAYVVDPVVVDEMEPCTKLSGMPGVERRSVFHALNTKAVCRKCAYEMGMRYEDGRFIVAHMGGGITVGAHKYGRVVDVNDGIAGEGPFSPERCGSVPLAGVVEMCYSGKYTKAQMMAMLNKNGGMLAYLGTNDLKKVEWMIKEGDSYAALVVDSMAYQVSKEIGAMAAVLEGRIDAIVLTGGLAYSTRFTGAIKGRVDQIAPVMTYPGEDEMLALASGVLRVLTGQERAAVYDV